jgi:hypothetical protein
MPGLKLDDNEPILQIWYVHHYPATVAVKLQTETTIVVTIEHACIVYSSIAKGVYRTIAEIIASERIEINPFSN